MSDRGRPPVVSRPALRLVPRAGMVVLINSHPRCEGTVLQVDHHRETVLIYTKLYGIVTFWWREISREVLRDGEGAAGY